METSDVSRKKKTYVMSFTNPKCSKHFWSHFPFTYTTNWIRAPTKKPKSWSVFFHPLARLQACSQQYLGHSYPSYHPSFPMALPNHLRVENPTHGSMVCLFFELFIERFVPSRLDTKDILRRTTSCLSFATWHNPSQQNMILRNSARQK